MLSFTGTFVLLLESVEALGVLVGIYLAADFWLGEQASPRRKAAVLTSVFALGALLVLLNGISPDGVIRFDLRFVVLMAATLFLPWQGSLVVAASMISWRAFLGIDAGFYASSLGAVLTWSFCSWLSRKVPLASSGKITRKKVMTVAAATVAGSVLPIWVTFASYALFLDGPAPSLAAWAPALSAASLIQIVGAFVLAGLMLFQAERNDARRRLQEFERRAKSVLSAIPDSLVVQDRSGTYLEVLSEGKALLDMPCPLEGRNMGEFFPAEQVHERLQLIAKALDEGVVVEALSQDYVQANSNVYRDVRAVPLDSSSVLVLLRDVSDMMAMRRELHSRSEQLGMVLAHTRDLLGFLEPDGSLTCLTPKSYELTLGHAPDQLKGLRLDSLLEDRHVRQFRQLLRSFKEGTAPSFEFQGSVVSAKGTPVWLEFTFTRLPSPQEGQAGRLLVVARDVTQRKTLEFFKRMSSQAFESLKDGIVVVDDEEGRIHWANKAFQDLSGYSDTQSHLQPLNQLLKSVASEQPMPSTLDLVVSGQWQGEFLSQDQNGRWFPEHRRVTFFEDADSGKTFHVVVMRDLSHKKAAAQALEQLAHNDLLTGLPNRRAFLSELENRLAKAQSGARTSNFGIAVIAVDIANFSNVNKSMGRQTGDLLLRQVAQGLKACAPERAFLARVEADEFAMMMPFTSQEAATLVAQELLSFFDKPLKLLDRDIFLTGYAGVSFSQNTVGHPELLLHEAHLALDDAAQGGERAIAFYDSQAAQRTHRNLLIENQLRKSLSEDPGSFYLKYQPKVSLTTGSLVGLEALCRWTYGDANQLGPADFIPVAEQAGLIDTLGLRVFEEACRQIAQWTREGTPPLSVAVNVSTQQLREEDLPNKLLSVTRKHGILPSMVELEVTESDVMRDVDRAVESLQRLRRLGFKIALDDFGTGYSSMAYLQKLPLDTLKLDRSFVQNLGSDRSSDAICEAILALAHSVNLFTVAEGVETEEQRRFLAAKGCDAMQGYLFSPPVPPSELDAVRRLTCPVTPD